tara:strand:- start:1212 stop:1454 length:243 start_codon:yes stop_codon:yes gene_type:complete
MIYLIKLIVILGMIAFPIIKTGLKGAVKATIVKGLLFGTIYDTSLYQVSDKDGTESMLKIHVIQFYLGFFAISMAWKEYI